MSNHVPLLLRPKEQMLALLMRRLLTGYAVHFNLRHHRSGHRFQSRYQLTVCPEDADLLALVRYLHENLRGWDFFDRRLWLITTGVDNEISQA